MVMRLSKGGMMLSWEMRQGIVFVGNKVCYLHVCLYLFDLIVCMIILNGKYEVSGNIDGQRSNG